MKPTKKNKLFIVTGASGVGKSTACEVLFQKETRYIVMESDLLWSDIHNTPEDGYRAYRELWLNVCASISQIGLPVVLCGCTLPEQNDVCEARKYFSEIIYIAVVADKCEIIKRMKVGRNITDEGWINSSVQFNEWIKNNAGNTSPNLLLVDATGKTPQETAQEIDNIIMINY